MWGGGGGVRRRKEEKDSLVSDEAFDAFSHRRYAILERVTSLPVLHVHVSTVAN